MSRPMSDLFPPFAPDANEPRKRFKPVPFRVIAPNLVTLIALCLGLTAIRLAYDGRLEPAVYAILAAALLDGVDGRLARLLKGTSRFGAELDSLSDFLSFGAAPALVLHTFVLHHVPGLGWTAALIFAMAMALRLARFNVMLDDPNRPEWQKNFFVGMAAPAGAITSLLPLYLYFLGVPMGPGAAPVVLVYVLGLAFLTVSTIPMYSGKTMGKRVPRHWVLPIFLVTVATFGLIVNFPFEVLTLGTLLFLGSIPFGVRRYRALERTDRESTALKGDTPEPTPSL